MCIKNSIPVAALLVLTLSYPAVAQDNQAIIDEALSAASPQIAERATVMNMAGEVLHQGNGGHCQSKSA